MSDINKNSEDKISKHDKLVLDIRGNLSTRMTDLMSKLLNSALENLFDMSEDADNNEDRLRYFELMNQVRKLKPDIAIAFDSNIKELLVPSKVFAKKQEQQKIDNDDGELSLVGQDEMEGIVLVKSIGERAGSKYREQLQHLEARFEFLALKSTELFNKDALIPTNFCQAFDNALADNFDNTDKKILFSMFDVEIVSKLDALYDSINNRLIDAGILPQIKLHSHKSSPSRPRPKPMQATGEDAGQQYDPNDAGNYDGGSGYAGSTQYGMGASSGGGGPAGNNPGGNNISGFAMTAAPGGTYRHPNFNATQGQNSNTENGGTSYSSENKNAGEGEYQHYTAGMPANQVGRILGNYLSGTPITPGQAGASSSENTEFFPVSTPQHFGHQEIIQALSSVQNLPQFDQHQPTKFDSEAIKQAVLAEIAKTSGGAVTKRINQIAEKTIDFIELIFDAIIDDSDISDTIKTLLLRMQIPIIKASMADQEFFIYDDHPARVLLDTIADVGVGITDHTDDIYQNLDKVVSMVLGEYDLTTETFQHALDNLNSLIEEQEASARAIEEAEQQQILRKHARVTVLKALRATTTGKALPEAVHPLILKRWPTLLFNHYLKCGKENNEWVNLVLTLRHIVESVQPITSPEQLAKLTSEKDALITSTEEFLNISSHSKKDVQEIITIYRETIQSHCDDANFTKEEVSKAAEIVSKAGPVDEPPIEAEETEKHEMPANIMPGMWFQVHMGEDQNARRCKLSVIIVEDANLMFVNHKGELVTEKSFDEFNDEVTNKTTKMIMGHSAFDHAFKSVINRLD